MDARFSFALAASILALGCGGETPLDDAGVDSSTPPRPDAGRDAGRMDAGFDAGADAGFDAGPFDGGPSSTVTFPPRDFVCASSSTPCDTTVPLRSNAERTVVVPRDMGPTTLTYVVNTLALPEATFASTAAGFNLDAMDSKDGSVSISANCEEFNQDFRSIRDPGHVGIDNAFQGLIGTAEGLMDAADCPGGTTDGCIDATIRQQILDGELLLLIELTDVHSFRHDESVQVALYAAEVPGGGTPTPSGGGGLAPGQTFDTVSTLVAPMSADIFDGRLRVQWSGRVPLTLSGTSALLPLQLDDPELRADMSPTGLTLGVIGATTSVDFFVAQSAMIMPGIEDTVRSIMESIADVGPTSDPAVCRDVSSGFLFDAVTAIRR